jgi:transposase
VAVKSAEHQARAVAFRTHQSFVGQRTQLINALRGHLAEFGLVVAQGPANLKSVVGMIDDGAIDLPDAVRDVARLYLDQIALLTNKIEELHSKLVHSTKVDDAMRRLCTVPGVGPVTAGAIMAFAPDLRTFASGRNFAAWLGLVPRQRSTGGKTRLGSVSKMGQADIRKLLIVGAMSRIRWIVRKGVLPDNWLGHVLGRKPRMVAAVALANKMARMIWAMMTREENYRMA